MDFMIRLPIFTDWKSNSYDSILIIVNHLIKMVHYEPVYTTIDAPGVAKVIINVIVWHHGLLNSIVSDQGLVFTLKFWFSVYYFLGIKQKLSTTFHPQINDQIKR